MLGKQSTYFSVRGSINISYSSVRGAINILPMFYFYISVSFLLGELSSGDQFLFLGLSPVASHCTTFVSSRRELIFTYSFNRQSYAGRYSYCKLDKWLILSSLRKYMLALVKIAILKSLSILRRKLYVIKFLACLMKNKILHLGTKQSFCHFLS